MERDTGSKLRAQSEQAEPVKEPERVWSGLRLAPTRLRRKRGWSPGICKAASEKPGV